MIRLILLLIVLSVVNGCASTTNWDSQEIADTGRAEELAAQGKHQAAADAYFELANQSADFAQRQRFLILMAHERYLAGFPEVAQTILDRLGDPVDQNNLLLWSLVSAEISIATGDPEQALAVLQRAPDATELPDALELLRLKGNALFRTGQPVAATNVLVERETWLDNQQDILANQLNLWESYQTWGGYLTDEQPADPILAGWLEIGQIAWTQRTSMSAMQKALRLWQARYFKHPARDVLVPQILARLPAVIEYPQQIAVLLPMSGRQQQAALAVRDGLLAAYFQADDAARPQMRFYDLNQAGTVATYQQAISDGADFVVGPLLKEEVEELAEAGISAPTLTLNFLPEESSRSVGFYQFSLSPEDEARQIAQRAAALGQLRALVLAPDNDWGERLLNSFNEELRSLGGQILDFQLYDPRDPDYSSTIERLLLIDESRARHDRLKANLGIKLGYEPRRRADIDIIFMAARARNGKLIRPQLRFHYAGDVPTYSTSAIYEEGSRNNSDLNGIMFPDVPWVIAPDGLSVEVRQTLDKYWPDQAERRSRLYALGFDAYRLIPIVNSGIESIEIEGMTGTLYFDNRNRVLRRLRWAKMQRGQPVLMEAMIRPGQGSIAEEPLTQVDWPNTSTTAEVPNE